MNWDRRISHEATKARSYQMFLRVFVSSWRPAAVLIQRGRSTSTTLLDPQMEIAEFHHRFQVVRMRDEEVCGEHLGDDRASNRQTRWSPAPASPPLFP